MLFAVIGISFPLFEWSFPELYPAMSPKELTEKYIPDGFAPTGAAVISTADVESFLETEPSAMVIYGRALYPAYYEQGTYWGDAPHLAESKQYDRLEFLLIGARRSNVYIPMQTVTKYFPHASSVFVIGCNTPSSAIRALVIKVNDTLVLTSPWRGLTCSSQ
jgi:hypothetical protein